MTMLNTGRVSLLGVMLASFGVSEAARETMSLTEGGVTFTVVHYDDGRNKPYRLRFGEGDTRSLYTFNSAQYMTNIKVGTEKYELIYDTSDNLESVELTSSTRRALAENENDAAAIEGRRLDFDDCTSCEVAYHAMCYGARDVCDLVDYGSPFSATAAASIDTMCETFGSACDNTSPEEACQDQCPEEVFSLNRCLRENREEYKCTFSGDTTIKFTDCYLTDGDVAFLPACFENFGKTNIQKLYLDNGDIASYAEGTFAGLSEMTSLDLYSNKLVTVSEGLFDGLTKLEFLDMAYNDLVSLPEGAFSDLSSLTYLRLFNNELTPESLPLGLFAGVPLLQSLELGNNFLTDMTGLEGLFDGLTELTHLGLNESGIQIVPAGLFAGLAKLESLSFWINWISFLPDGLLSDLTELRELELSNNNLTDLGSSLVGITELRTLLLEHNNELVVTEDLFSDLVNLEELHLYNCGLTTLPAGIFSPLVNLVELKLWDNDDLQCVPSTAATTEVDVDSEFVSGTCECTPVEAVFCDDGVTCQSGMSGYTCVA